MRVGENVQIGVSSSDEDQYFWCAAAGHAGKLNAIYRPVFLWK